MSSPDKIKAIALTCDRLFVIKENFAVFGESTQRGVITQNCYESMLASGIKLPEWFQHPNGEYITLGKLQAALWYGTNY